jgi:hypothetical protein
MQRKITQIFTLGLVVLLVGASLSACGQRAKMEPKGEVAADSRSY